MSAKLCQTIRHHIVEDSISQLGPWLNPAVHKGHGDVRRCNGRSNKGVGRKVRRQDLSTFKGTMTIYLLRVRLGKTWNTTYCVLRRARSTSYFSVAGPRDSLAYCSRPHGSTAENTDCDIPNTTTRYQQGKWNWHLYQKLRTKMSTWRNS
jgi:hypothetical protein